jgi:hypothetical protein
MPIFGQNNLSFSFAVESGLIQYNAFEPNRQDFRNKLTPSISPTVLIEWQIPKKQIQLRLKSQYTFNSMPFSIKGNPLFRDGEGFPTQYVRNDHINLALHCRHKLIGDKKYRFYGFLGLNMGIPLLEKNRGAYTEGTSYYQDGSFYYELQYTIVRLLTNPSIGLDSGLSFEINLLDYLALNFDFQYRLGFRQSVIYAQSGEIYISSQPLHPLFDAFWLSFSNSGIFLSAGLKFYL